MIKAEFLDVLDENGNHTGTKKLRSDIHKLGDWHRAAHAWIINPKGELLLQRRGQTKETHPNMFDTSVAGHIEAGQTSLETVLKESKEELGLELNPEEPKLLFSYQEEKVLNNGSYINRGFHDVYLIQKNVSLATLSIDQQEVGEVRYVPWRKVKEELAKGNAEFVAHPNEYPKLFEILKERF